MKKITLFFTMVFCAFAWQSNAQFTEGFETAIPATWTVINNGGANGWVREVNPSGGAFEGTAVASITYNVEAHDDYLVTPAIDVTAGVTDRFSFYVKSRSGFFSEPYEILLSTSTPDAAGLTVVLQASSDAAASWVPLTFDLSDYDGQTVYVAVHATGTNEFQLFLDDFVLDGQVTDTLNYYNLQYPATGNISIGETFEVYAQAFQPGLTDVTTDQAAGIESWIGYSIANTDPSGAGWTWVVAEYNTASGVNNNDEYFLNLGAVVPTVGTIYYASRWSLNTGPYTYGGIQADESFGGIWGDNNNISGVLTVTGPVNDDCSGAIALTVNADYQCGVRTSSSTTGATASAQPDDATGTPNNDVWFTFTATTTGHRIVISNVVNVGGGSSTSTDMGMSVFNDLAGCSMVAANEVGESDPDILNLTGLTVGNVYYVRVYGWFSSVQNNNFDICVGSPPACDIPTGLTATSDLTSAVISWTAPSSGTPTGYNWEVQPEGVVQGTAGAIDSGFTTDTTDTVTGLTQNTTYDLYVQTDCGADGTSVYAGPYSFTSAATPPGNDDCATATTLTPGLTYDANPLDGTVLGATLASETSTCAAFGQGPGVWYSVVVPNDGIITIETGPDAGTGNTGFDSQIEAFSGTCDALVSIDCDDDGASTGSYSLLNLTGLEAGSTIFVRVWEYGGDETEPFSVSAYSATLSIAESNVLNSFTYFPNPVKNELKLKAQSNIQTVIIFNMLGQEVLKTAPNKLTSDINMTELQTGAYFVKVTINDATETIRVIKQ